MRTIFTICFAIVLATLSAAACKDCCDNLDVQIVDGKWKTYDMVLGNCLVKKFIKASTSEDVDFYLHMSALETQHHNVIDLYERGINKINEGEHTNRIRLEFALKTAKRGLQKRKLELDKMLEESRLKVALIEAEIRDFMEKCTLKFDVDTDICPLLSEDTLQRLKELCHYLKSQTALLLAEILNSEVNSKKEDSTVN